ncbi:MULTISPECIES: hypothetical protein [unclassified Paenibacillus]|uniref:hypothetical protein n=1 Tax=unclassified Paenibacillus TaxID=185978 RepID=UPI0012EBF948|nr:hypothetical protein [Paenibacillus sp. FSL R5-192]
MAGPLDTRQKKRCRGGWCDLAMVGSCVISRDCSPIPLAASHRSANPAQLRCGQARWAAASLGCLAPVAPQGGA